MEKKVLFFLICFLFINLVSAVYECTGTVSTEESVINIGDIKSINDLRIGLIDSSSGGAAEILISARILALTDELPSVNVTLDSGFHEINLTNLNSSFASIKLGNSTGNLELRTINEIGNLQFYMTNFNGTYPGADANVQFFVGDEYLFLYGANPASVQTIGSEEYLIVALEQYSSSGSIEVQTCSGDFVEVPDSVELNPNDFESSNPSQDDPSQNEPPAEENTEVDEPENLEGSQENILSRKVFVIITIVVAVLMVAVAVFIVYKLKKKGTGVVPKEKNLDQAIPKQER